MTTSKRTWIWTAFSIVNFQFSIVLSSCVKDTLHATPHPDRGAVVVTVDRTDRAADAVVPPAYILRLGTREQAVTGTTNVLDTLLPPGRHSLLVYHHADGITVNGNTAAVNKREDGSLEAMPAYLFSGAAEPLVVADDTTRVTVTARQRVRALTLALKLAPGDEERVTATTATLSGIVPAVDLATGAAAATTGTPVTLDFALSTEPDAINERARTAATTPSLAATARLLGVMTAERQILSLVFLLEDGTPTTITTDLTEALRDFNSGTSPLALDATLQLPAIEEIEAGISATIGSWNIVDNGKININ